MPTDADGVWHPTSCPKRDLLRSACQNFRYVAANGRRYTGKTIGCLHALVEHAWNTNPGNVGIITISQSVGMDSGVWQDLTKIVIPEWIEGGFGLRWVKEPGINGTTKRPHCEISNVAGGTTAISLESLQNEQEVEDRFKPKRYSMLYVPELTTFSKRQTFDTWCETLRMIGLPEEKHLLLVDYNPPDQDSWWIYNLWYELAGADEAKLDVADYGLDPNDPDSLAALLELKRNLFRLDFFLEDNPWADPKHCALLKARYAHNPDLYKRYILGEPTQTTEHSLFANTFRETVHAVGERETPQNKDPETSCPKPGCLALYCGWDPGDSVNSAAVIAEMYARLVDVIKVEGGDDIEIREPVINWLDELVITGTPHRLEGFTEEFMRKMLKWERVIGREGKTKWRHVSDRSVYERMEPRSLIFLADLVFRTSRLAMTRERDPIPISSAIVLEAADRSPGSLGPGIDLWNRLLFEERMFFSAANCPKLIEMNKTLRKPKSGAKLIQSGSPAKHPFDAARYLVQELCYDELERDVMAQMTRSRKAGQKSSLVSISL